MLATQSSPTSGNQQGATLLEALISILVFSLGILSIVALQAAAVRHTTDAQFRIQAGVLADQLLGYMWTDKKNLASYVLQGPQICASGSSITKDAWICSVQSQLPSAVGSNSPEVLVTSDGVVSVTLKWQRSPGDEVRRHSVRTQIKEAQ